MKLTVLSVSKTGKSALVGVAKVVGVCKDLSNNNAGFVGFTTPFAAKVGDVVEFSDNARIITEQKAEYKGGVPTGKMITLNVWTDM